MHGPKIGSLAHKRGGKEAILSNRDKGIKGAWVLMVVRAYYGLSWQPKPQINSNFL